MYKILKIKKKITIISFAFCFASAKEIVKIEENFDII